MFGSFSEHWINMQKASHVTKFKSKVFLLIHKLGRPFRWGSLNDWLQKAMASVARWMNVKLDHCTYTTHTLREGGCTDVANMVLHHDALR